ncbi:MAG: hypothetical protein KDB64_12325 [Solirubrobacterales bacterium]|nr:hypothetical protein [Solirubrobacterales bacterium]
MSPIVRASGVKGLPETTVQLPASVAGPLGTSGITEESPVLTRSTFQVALPWSRSPEIADLRASAKVNSSAGSPSAPS